MNFSLALKSLVLVLFLAEMSPNAAAQEAQLVFEDAWFAGESLKHVVSTSDNGHVIGVYEDRKIKLDAAGDPMWCKSYGFETFLERATPDDGTVSMSFPEFVVHAGPLQDTLVMRCSLMKLNSSGDVEWARTLSSEFLGEEQLEGDLYGGGCMEVDEEGRIALALHCTALTPRPIWVVELDQTGVSVWSRTITDMDPRLSRLSIALDGVGGVYLLSWYDSVDLWDPAEFDLVKLSVNGDLGWMRTGTFVSGGMKGGSLICSNGHPVIGALQDSGSNFYGYLISLHSDGTLAWLNRYFGPGGANDNQDVWELRALDNGELFAAHYAQNEQWSEEVIIRFAEDGSVMDAAKEVPMDIAGYSFHVDWGGVDVRGSTVAIATSVHRQAPWDPQPGLAGIWSLGLDLNGCMLAPVTVSVTTFNSFVEIAAVDPLISASGLDPISIDISVQMEAVPTTGDACSLPMYIETPSVAHSTLDVRPTMVPRGSPIQIRSSTPGRLEIRDVTGRCFSTMRLAANVPVEFDTAQLGSGTCLVSVSSDDGDDERVRKVLVE